jgi:tetratricopeptide (TPR) repeat protein
MPRRPNPYIAGPPVSGRNFYGREDIFRFVQNTFSSPQQNVIVLWGQRRMGKTSVLHELFSRLSPEFHPIYFDLQDKAQQKLNEVLYDLSREIAGSLNLDAPPRADFLRDDDYFHESFLPQVYQSLGPKRLLFMIDEFEVLDMLVDELAHDAALQAFFPYLRRALMQDEQLAFVFVVGRRLDELDELLQSTFKMAKTASISFLEEAEAKKLVVGPASGILEYDEEAVGRIISITSCHPYLTQLVCSEIFSYMEAAGRSRVMVGDVEAVVDKAIAVGRAGLAWLWRELPTAERFVLAAVAHAAKEGRAATQDEIDRILEEYRIPFSGRELTQAPDNLTTWGLLRRTADGYEFVVELLRRWILREHPLEQARRELESVSPRATRWYELASELHRVVGELDGAIRFYKRALVINPNHVQARLGLAQALFELDRIEEAIKEYTEVYHLNEVIARDGLIAARQKRAEALEEAGQANEADQEYKTILNIASYDLRVRKWIADRWTARGKQYLAEGRYEEAIAEYEKATGLDGPDAYEGLIAARRSWAEALEREDKIGEADQQYEAILRMAPDDGSVRGWVANSLIERGDRYLEKGRYDEASKFYDRAENIQPESQPILARRRRHLELVPDYDRAMRAHQARDWATAEKEWAKLYREDPDYARRDGRTVAVLLAEAIEKREGISKRRQRRFIFALSGLVAMFATLILWLGWGSVVTSGQIGAGLLALVIRTPTPITPRTSVLLPTNTPYPTYTPHPTYTPYPTLATPASTPTPIPSPTPRFPAPRLIGPENGHEFFEGDAARIILQWEPVGSLAENEWYQVVLRFFKLGEIQYGGTRLKESEWQVPAYFHGHADLPERAYYWDVTVVQVDKDSSDGTETCIGQSPSSETWTFYWP